MILSSITPLQAFLHQFLLGMVVMAAAIAGLFFVRFWRKTHDRLFAIFAVAFWTLGANWLALAVTVQDEFRTALYVLRLFAFVLIIIGILDKNYGVLRKAREKESPPTPQP